MHAAALLAAQGHALEALARGAAAASSLRPSDLCVAYASGLDGAALDSPRLLALARCAVDALNRASCAGGAEASDFQSRALHDSSLFTLVFRDAREAEAAAARHLCVDTVTALELSSRRAALTVTRAVKPGALVRTMYTRADGVPLQSFVLFGEDDEKLIDGLVAAFAEAPCPRAAFALCADSRLPHGEVAGEEELVRAQLIERFVVASSEAYIALITVMTHTAGLGLLPAPDVAHICAIATAVDLSPRELEGLFLTIGRCQAGVALLSLLVVFAPAGPVVASLLGPTDGLRRVLVALASLRPALDDASTNGCLMVLSYASGHSERAAQALVDLGAFTLLQPSIRHDNLVVAVRAAFTVASIAVSCGGAAEPLRWSGALEVISSTLRAVSCGMVIIPGFFIFSAPSVIKLLQPGVEPMLQLAALHRLGAALTGTTLNADAVTSAPLISALRGCFASHDAHVCAAARYVLKELLQPLHAPLSPSPDDLNATIAALTLTAAAGAQSSEDVVMSARLAESAAAIRQPPASASVIKIAQVSLAQRLDASERVAKDAEDDAEADESASSCVPSREEATTRNMITDLLSRAGASPPETEWHTYSRTSISEAQIDALASIGAVNRYGAPRRPVALPDAMRPLFLPSTRAALVRFGILEESPLI